MRNLALFLQLVSFIPATAVQSPYPSPSLRGSLDSLPFPDIEIAAALEDAEHDLEDHPVKRTIHFPIPNSPPDSNRRMLKEDDKDNRHKPILPFIDGIW